jgi:uncharacterized caspase-like protein
MTLSTYSKGDDDPPAGDDGGSKTGMGLDGYALLIGTGYCQHSPQWSLPVTVRDVKALHKVLVSPDHCAYPDDKGHITVLTDEQATRKEILAALDSLASVTAKNPDATVMICYTGHGWKGEGDRYYLIPSDILPFRLMESALPASDFIAGLRRIRARRLLVLMDTCHAEAMATVKGSSIPLLPDGFHPEPLPKSVVEELGDSGVLHEGEDRAVFASCRQNQKSWVLPDNTLSIFTHHLIAGLKGAGNTTGEHSVMVSDLMKYVSREVESSARAMQQVQTPIVMFETNDFEVAKLSREEAATEPVGKMTDQSEAQPNTVQVGEAHAGRDINVVENLSVLQTGSSKP